MEETTVLFIIYYGKEQVRKIFYSYKEILFVEAFR